MGTDLRIFKEDISSNSTGRMTKTLTEVATIYDSNLIDKLQTESNGYWNVSSECGAIFELPKEVIMKYKEDILKFDKTAQMDLVDDSFNSDYFHCELSF